MKLQQKGKALIKEESGVTFGIEKGANLGVTIYRHEDQTMLAMQFDKMEQITLSAYLGSKDLLCETIKNYEELNQSSLERMEELRDTIKDLMSGLVKASRFIDRNSKEFKEISLSLDKAKNQLE